MTKPQWTTALFDAMAARPNVHAFFWFNQNNSGEADWRINLLPEPRGTGRLSRRGRQRPVVTR